MCWKNFYLRIYKKARPYKNFITKANACISYLFYVTYPLLLIYVLFTHQNDIWKTLAIPGISFILVTLLRKKIGRIRPYECFQISPMIAKETKQNSMPSRHIFSTFVITMAVLYYDERFGLFLLVFSIIEAILRVIGGVHFMSDVLVGALLGICSGLLIFIL